MYFWKKFFQDKEILQLFVKISLLLALNLFLNLGEKIFAFQRR